MLGSAPTIRGVDAMPVLDAQGQVVEILSIGNDITERLSAEKEIRELKSEIIALRNLIEKKKIV